MLVFANSFHPWDSNLQTRLLLQSCRTQNDVNQLHAGLLTTGYINKASLTAKIIINFISSPHKPLVEFARHVFFTRPARRSPRRRRVDSLLWNAVIKSFSHGCNPERAFAVFFMMLENGVCVDKFSFSLVLKACSRLGLQREGRQIHGLLSKLEIRSDLFLNNCLISWYLRCGHVELARQMFDRMPKRDSVSYNSMIDGYVKNGMIDLGRQLFDEMPLEEKNLVSWNSLIAGYAQSEDGLKMAWELFESMEEKHIVSWNAMIDGCAKCGKMEDAYYLFNRMPTRDVISWSNMISGYARLGSVDIARSLFDDMPEKDVVSCNAMMSGYTQNGYCIEALELFHALQEQSNLSPDDATMIIVLSAIAQLGNIDEGMAVHSYLKEHGFSLRGKLGVALIDMYCKCGCIEDAILIFEDINDKRIDHWNAMIGGLAIHGLGKLAFGMIMQMGRLSVTPDDITYIGALNACGHAGLVKEGMICFEHMRRVHKLVPKLQHYGCMVDILGRAGLLQEALKFIQDMPIEPNDVIWRTLLSACQNHEDFSIGEPTAKHLMRLDSCNPSYYVLLSNIYAGLGLWDEVRKVRGMMKRRNIVKVPGRSWIELEGIVHEFFVQDKTHPQVTEIYSVLNGLRTSNLQATDYRC